MTRSDPNILANKWNLIFHRHHHHHHPYSDSSLLTQPPTPTISWKRKEKFLVEPRVHAPGPAFARLSGRSVTGQIEKNLEFMERLEKSTQEENTFWYYLCSFGQIAILKPWLLR
jgi:hypothetical protein